MAFKTGNNRGQANLQGIAGRLASLQTRRKSRSGGKSCIQDFVSLVVAKGIFMTEAVIKLRLNQQQLELMDRTIAQGVAPDRVSLVRLALREYAAARRAESKTGPAQ
jgi:hypothetical protein